MAVAIRELESEANTSGIPDRSRSGGIADDPEWTKLLSSMRTEVLAELIAAQFVNKMHTKRLSTLSTGIEALADTFSIPLAANIGQLLHHATVEKEFEDAFQRLGLWSRPYFSRTSPDPEFDFWKRSGRQGARWLVRKIRTEGGNETLNGVADVLSKLGTTSLFEILENLEDRPSVDQAYCLLNTIGRMGRQADGVIGRIVRAVGGYIRHPDLDVREAAIFATSALPPADALQILRSALATESDPTVKEAIRKEIEDRLTE